MTTVARIPKVGQLANHQFPKAEHPETLLALNCTTDGEIGGRRLLLFHRLFSPISTFSTSRDLLLQLNDSVFRILLFRSRVSHISGARFTQSRLGSVRHQFVITSCDTLFSDKHILSFSASSGSFLSLVLLLLLTNS